MPVENKQSSELSKVGIALGINLIIFLGLVSSRISEIGMDSFFYGIFQGPVSIAIGFILLFPRKTRGMGATFILTGLVLTIIGFSACANSSPMIH